MADPTLDDIIAQSRAAKARYKARKAARRARAQSIKDPVTLDVSTPVIVNPTLKQTELLHEALRRVLRKRWRTRWLKKDTANGVFPKPAPLSEDQKRRYAKCFEVMHHMAKKNIVEECLRRATIEVKAHKLHYQTENKRNIVREMLRNPIFAKDLLDDFNTALKKQ
jgi:hypothetical protein